MGFATNDFCPFLGVFVTAGHHNLHLLLPIWAQFKDALVDFHRYRTRVTNYHSLTTTNILAIVLIVCDDVIHKVINRRITTQQGIHVRHFLLVLFQVCFRCALFSQSFILSINLGKYCIIEFQFDHTTFIIDRSCGTIIDSLSHIIHINIITKDFARVSILV